MRRYPLEQKMPLEKATAELPVVFTAHRFWKILCATMRGSAVFMFQRAKEENNTHMGKL
jgi:hypothetical protein